MNPLENAIETIKEKNLDLLIKTHSSIEIIKKISITSPLIIKTKENLVRNGKDIISQLGMVLNGNINHIIFYIFMNNFLQVHWMLQSMEEYKTTKKLF